jgi:SAM-dependent methyltransferase
MTLSREQAKAFYDRFGSKQDWQGFYEDRALTEMIAWSAFDRARHVFELGCGTGRLAERLLTDHLPPDSAYSAIDISTTMIELARHRLVRFGARVQVVEAPPGDPFGLLRSPVDRVVSTYVLDLLPDREITDIIKGSARILEDHGRICLVSLTPGVGPFSRLLSSGWQTIFRLNPRLLGGCRPVRLLERFSPEEWSIVHRRIVSAFGLCSEVVIAEKIREPKP